MNVSPRLLSTHSLRKGGACRLQELGAYDDLIRAKGRWTSEAYQIYIAHQPLSSKKLRCTKFVSEPKLRQKVEAIQGEAEKLSKWDKAKRLLQQAKRYQATKTYYYRGTRYVHTWLTQDGKRPTLGVRRKRLCETNQSRDWATEATKAVGVQTNSIMLSHAATQVLQAGSKSSATQVATKDLHFFCRNKAVQTWKFWLNNAPKNSSTQTSGDSSLSGVSIGVLGQSPVHVEAAMQHDASMGKSNKLDVVISNIVQLSQPDNMEGGMGSTLEFDVAQIIADFQNCEQHYPAYYVKQQSQVNFFGR